MYAIIVLHSYITAKGKRTYDKNLAWRFNSKEQAMKLADKLGGSVAKVG
ncbi:hypothetical protein [Enterococcus xiangfangensis]|uniref:Uncharacterized protein n=1 Tax=Enterococcus xiangfangensis TaxID=1296537 RepID=A0ABU3FCV2_9ENTE|nr:hypothetical protein [Enterococcus xiangfangensis]MBM7711305.1 hypothetical protein [Enterococcus xiangfangensis]MDT2759500.1 hypothetical protein [Enterococcus xiangfangensis]